jgi:hypothetical protein
MGQGNLDAASCRLLEIALEFVSMYRQMTC